MSEIISGREPTLVTQSYLGRSSIPDLLRRYEIGKTCSYHEQFTVARIRASTDPSGSTTYELEFKGPKYQMGSARISRPILPKPHLLSKTEFTQLSSDATKGTLLKKRYVVPGTFGKGNAVVKCIAEVDEFLGCGVPVRKIENPFMTADIEFADEKMAESILEGHHSFSFLRSCPDMNYSNTELGRLLSNRKIARHGMGKEQIFALSEFSRLAERLLDL